jgi:hypothetical protein
LTPKPTVRAKKLEINLAGQILETYREANQLAASAKGYASQAVIEGVLSAGLCFCVRRN